MVVRDLLQDLGVLQLSLENILLIALTYSIPRLGGFLDLIQQAVAFLQDSERLLNIGQAEIDHLEISDNGPAD